jgi:hypothetical protein
MNRMARPSRWHRWTTGLAVIALSAAALVGTAGSAAADVTDNNTPASARTFSSVPFEDYAGAPVDNPAATDATGRKVATACNGGSDIYGTAWWKYAPAARSTVVVHSALRVGPTPDQPTGLAVVSADLSTVLKCGVEGGSISDAGAFTVEAGSSLFIVAYYDEPTETSILSPTIGVYPSSGVVPANDNYEAATTITSLPFSATQDTTLATLRTSDPVCYDREGAAANVWYSVTVPTTQRLEVTVDTNYSSHLVVATSTEDQSTWQCDTPQFEAQAGVTYLIGVAGTNSLRNSGQLTITVSAAPAAPAVSLRIAATGKVTKRTGVVRLSGSITCSGSDTSGPVSGTIKQVYRRVIHTQSFNGTSVTCSGAPARWTAVIEPTTFKWTTGQATITASVTACNTSGCTQADAERKITLEAR